jgi:HD-GYP domain-containing protein (c-di-GMP phosphodiesterase class II)
VEHSRVIDIQNAAASLINQFAITLRTANIHSTSNVAFKSAAEKFFCSVNELIAVEHTLTLQLKGDYFYLNDQRVRYAPEYVLNFDFLAGIFKKIEVGTITIKDKLNLEHMEFFIHAFVEADFLQETFDVLSDKISRISIIKLKRLEEITSEEDVSIRRLVRKTYFNSIFYVKGVFSKIKSGEQVDVRKAKRVVTSVVSTIIEHEQILLGMTAIKDYDEYTYYHCTNVSILSVALGQRLGLNREMLVDLGIASLFHDLGKIDVPYEVLNKPTRLDDSDWRIIKKHPLWGVKSMLKIREIDDFTIRAALVAFEHHMNVNHSGYPQVKHKYDLDLFSRIVSIADRYDAMTSERVYTTTPLKSDKALSILMENSDTSLDPLLLKFFINMIGVYPIGSLVRLSTNELGLVFENDSESLFRPRVILISDSRGNWIKGQVVDLRDKNEHNDYTRTITTTMDPRKYNINLAEYFL